MKRFSLSSAWSLGMSFFSGKAAGHAILLIGMGIIVPIVLQMAVTGGAMGMMNPAMMGQNALAGVAGLGGLLTIILLVTYLLQMGSYFASWRLGFGEDEAIVGATTYGLIAAVVMIVAFAVLIFLMVMLSMQMAGTPAAVVPVLLLLIPLLLLFAAVYTLVMAFIAVAMFLMLLIVAAFGASMGSINPAMSMTGGGAVGVLIMLVIALLLFWLAVRFSCTTSAMADRATVNLFAGLRDSWRMTAADQWRIMGYLALIGVVLCVVFFVIAVIAGAGMMASMRSGGGTPEMGVGMVLFTLVISIPFAYLTVLVPAGIYRELRGPAAAEVFA